MGYREIKFRAWDGEKIYLPSDHDTYIKLRLGVIYCMGIIFMQYTGLRDKNGVEIYESDIVMWREDLGPAIVTMGTLHEGDDEERTGWIALDCFVDDKCEVIGNIYENKELLDV